MPGSLATKYDHIDSGDPSGRPRDASLRLYPLGLATSDLAMNEVYNIAVCDFEALRLVTDERRANADSPRYSELGTTLNSARLAPAALDEVSGKAFLIFFDIVYTAGFW